ncbi:MAG: hypothetical protein UT05_C0005G0043 [Parcubacteria group bacterium GW2011_GWF2_38_76]|nr:MAG: hypothetical protein UT05_C0005G0043 [Parcubacteria group bacterium GW2011_GWF2_38_76]
MNSKLVWTVIVALAIYGGYLMMTKTATPAVETPVAENVVATTTVETTATTSAEVPASL